MHFLLLARALAVFFLVAIPAQAQTQGGSTVGPRVTSDQLLRDSTLNPNRATGQITVAPPVVPCGPSTVNWSVGAQSCSAAYPGGADGSSTTVQSTAGATVGTASAVCTSGVVTATGTCIAAASCNAAALSWTVSGKTCSANIAATSSGNSATINDVTAPETGSATYSCFNGTFTQQGATCATTAASCASQIVTWTVGGSTCSATTALTNSGGTASVSDVTGPTLGAANYACSNGTLSLQAGSTCSTAPAACSAQAVSWTQGANTCTASYTGGNDGTSQTVTDSTAPTVGSATSTCTNGVVSTAGSCAAATNCSAGQSLQWVVSSRQCTGTSSAGTSGNTISVTASGTNTGTAPFMCQADGSYALQAGATCNPGGAGDGGASCGSLPAGTPWAGAGSASCALTDPSPVLLSGTSLQVVDNVGFYQGSATVTCANGAIQLVNASCAQAQGGNPACPAGSNFQWTVGAATCIGALPAGDVGTLYSAVDSTTGADGGTLGATGLKPYSCTSSGWAPTGGAATCAVSGLSCPGQLQTWTSGANTCQGSTSASPPGSSVNIANTVPANTGGAMYQCNGSTGGWVLQPGSTCTANPVGCPSVFMEWQDAAFCQTPGDSSLCCSGTFAALASGGSGFATDSTGPTTGTAWSSCTNGTRSFTSASCAVPPPPPPPPPPCPSIAAGTYTPAVLGCGGSQGNAAVPQTAEGGTAWLTFPGNTAWGMYTCTSGSYAWAASGC
jgi:hypothetical protein